MATLNRPGDFVSNIASTGKSLMTAFTKFITYRKVQDRRLENLYATLSLTTNTLTDLGATLNKHETDFHIKEEAYRPLCETAKANLEKFLVLINEGISSGVWKNDGELGGKTFTAEVDPWLLITVSLGGKLAAKHFWESLDDTRDSLLELNDIVKYMILKNMNQQGILSGQQLDEFKSLTELLPHLVHSVEKAEKFKQEEEAAEKAKQERMKAAQAPHLRRRDTDEASDITLFVDPKPRGRSTSTENFNEKAPRVRNRSFDSYASVDSVPATPNTKEIYEEWLLRWNVPVRSANSSVKMFGITCTRSFEDPGFWGTDPELASQEDLKQQHQYALGNMSPQQHKEAMQKAIRAIPKRGGAAIDGLIEERTVSSNRENLKTVWEVVDVKAKAKFTYSSSKKWGKNPKTTDWFVVLRGEKVESGRRLQNFRRTDPWFRENARNSRGRYTSPRGRGYYERERSFSPIPRVRERRDPIIIHPRNRSISPRRGATMEAIPDDGFRLGTLVVGSILSKDEAAKKMEEIWARMTTKVSDPIAAE